MLFIMVSWVQPPPLNKECKEITRTMHTNHHTSVPDMQASPNMHIDSLRTHHGLTEFGSQL